MQQKLARSTMPGIFQKSYWGSSIDPLGSGYPQPISELSYGDSASALCSKGMLAALQIHVGSFCVLIWGTLFWLFLFLKDVFFNAY